MHTLTLAQHAHLLSLVKLLHLLKCRCLHCSPLEFHLLECCCLRLGVGATGLSAVLSSRRLLFPARKFALRLGEHALEICHLALQREDLHPTLSLCSRTLR
eukprot:SAG11_NODE_3365_length_2495_cov_1.544658_2_plen_101_part_00